MADAVDPTTLKGLRDRALLLLLGFASAFRRSDLVALDAVHLAERPEGLTVTIASSKTDQEGQGQQVATPRAAIAALRRTCNAPSRQHFAAIP